MNTEHEKPDDAPFADDEYVPHEFDARIPGEEDADGHIWCSRCDYHRDHEIHTGRPHEPHH